MSDPINNIVPGQEITDTQKEQLRQSNAAESAEAHRLAAEQQARDRAEGRAEPPINSIANMLKKKLEIGDIKPPEEGTRSRTKI